MKYWGPFEDMRRIHPEMDSAICMAATCSLVTAKKANAKPKTRRIEVR